MLRDELIAKLQSMPANVDVSIATGHYRVDVTGVNYDVGRDEIVLDFPADDMAYALARLESPTPERTNPASVDQRNQHKPG